MKSRGDEEEQCRPVLEHPLFHQLKTLKRDLSRGRTAGMIATRFVVRK